MNQRNQVFISYSHQDEEWLNRLKIMLAPLMLAQGIPVWDNTQINPGDIRENEIQKALASAKVAVLMVSHNFLADKFIINHELEEREKTQQKFLSFL